MADQQRLKQILNLSLKLTDQELKDYKLSEMDEERKEWLQKAIESILENDDGRKLLIQTDMFLAFNPEGNLSDNELSDLVNIFEEINFLCEGFDIAKEFDRLGGLIHCLNFLKSPYTSLHWRAADLIANCVHNNPKSQNNMLSNKGLEMLLYTLKTSDVEIVKVKCLYALSTVVGNFEPAQKLFIQLKGIDLILKLIKDSTGKLKTKSAFLLQKFVWNDVKFDELDYKEIFEDLLVILKDKLDDDTLHIVINCIAHLIDHDKVILELYKSKYSRDYQGFLEDQIETLTGNDEEKYEEEIKLYKNLLML